MSSPAAVKRASMQQQQLEMYLDEFFQLKHGKYEQRTVNWLKKIQKDIKPVRTVLGHIDPVYERVIPADHGIPLYLPVPADRGLACNYWQACGLRFLNIQSLTTYLDNAPDEIVNFYHGLSNIMPGKKGVLATGNRVNTTVNYKMALRQAELFNEIVAPKFKDHHKEYRKSVRKSNEKKKRKQPDNSSPSPKKKRRRVSATRPAADCSSERDAAVMEAAIASTDILLDPALVKPVTCETMMAEVEKALANV